MRTLNRPMFNMGGPIKQGIMHGIREPHQLGQIAGYGARALPHIQKAGNIFKNWFGKTIPASVKRGTHRVPDAAGSYSPVTITGSKFQPKPWVERDPIYQIGRKIKEGSGWIGKPIKWTAKSLATPTGALGLMFVGGRWLTSDGTPATDDQIAAHTAGQHGPFDHSEKKLAKKAQASFAEAQRDTRVKKYLDLMGYDRSKKTAVADALIDASKIVSDRGTLEKKNITRDLINPIIQATSKRFDKPEQIREAVGLMMVKGEIEKDLEDPQVKKLRALQIEKGEQELGENFETDMRNLLLSRKDKVKKDTLERYARLTADKYGENFTKVEGEGDMSGDGIYMVEDTIIRVTNGVPERIV